MNPILFKYLTRIICPFIFSGLPIFSQSTKTWDGDTNGNLGTAANWNSDSLPSTSSPGDNWVFTSTGAGTLESDLNNSYVNSITFNSGSYSYVIGGSGFSSSNILIKEGITNNSSSSQSFTGNHKIYFTIGDNHTINTASNDLLISNLISNLAGGDANLIKSGSEILTFTNTNDYTGTTTVSAGILKLTGSGKLGTTSGSTTVSSGATLQLDGTSTVEEDISISGTGTGAGGVGGALYKSNSGTVTISGDVALAADSTIDIDSGTMKFTGDITGSSALTYTGAGVIDLDADTNYSGATVIQGGNVTLSDVGGLGSTASGTTVSSSGILTLANGLDNVAEALALSTGTLKVSGTTSWSGGIALTGSNTVDYNKNSGSSLTLSGVISGSGNVDYNTTGTAGTIVVSGDNTYSGSTSITDAGQILQLEHADGLGDGGAAATTVASGASLKLNNASAMTISNENITISGTGVSSSGALHNASGSHTITNQLTLAADSSIAVDTSGQTLTLTNGITGSNYVLTKSGAGNLSLGTTASSSVKGLTYGGGGTFTGDVSVGSSGLAISGNGSAVSGKMTVGAASTWAQGSSSGSFIMDISGGMGGGSDSIGSNGYAEATGTTGSDWDALQFTGGLNMTGLSSGTRFNLNLNSAGNSTGWEWGKKVEIPIITGGVTFNGGSFDEDYFSIDSSGFTNGDTWWINWGLEYHNNTLWLTYEAVPETSTIVSISGLLFLLLFLFLKKKFLKKSVVLNEN